MCDMTQQKVDTKHYALFYFFTFEMNNYSSVQFSSIDADEVDYSPWFQLRQAVVYDRIKPGSIETLGCLTLNSTMCTTSFLVSHSFESDMTHFNTNKNKSVVSSILALDMKK